MAAAAGFANGKLTINTTDLETVKASVTAIRDYIQTIGPAGSPRELTNDLGLGMAIHRAGRLAEAIGTPTDYLNNRKTALVGLETTLGAEYNRTFVDLYSKGIPKKEAKRIAYAAAKSRGELEMAKINIDYPADIINATVGNEMGKTRAATGMKLLNA